jgi:hypothetical protein
VGTSPAGRGRGRDPLLDTPFFAFGRRPFREAQMTAYVLAQHRRGRPLSEILDDPRLDRLCREHARLLVNPRLVRALCDDALRPFRADADDAAENGDDAGPSFVAMLNALHA